MTQILALLGSLLNLLIDTIYKICRSLVVAFLVTFATAIFFAVLLVHLVT